MFRQHDNNPHFLLPEQRLHHQQPPQPPPDAAAPTHYPLDQPPSNAAAPTHYPLHQPQPPPHEDPNLHFPLHQPPPSSLRVPPPRKTSFLTWFLGVFCTIFWVIIIVTGLVILIVYLVFRPKSPKFDVSSATLNAAYLDMGYLLNADITILANFTNPNRKMSVDFNYMVINLYYEERFIATRYIDPFSVMRSESRFADIHMVTSQVALSPEHSQELQRQIEGGRGLRFQVTGRFRTRSNLGSFLKYSYWLYGHCTIIVSGPPSGVLVAKKCTTKR